MKLSSKEYAKQHYQANKRMYLDRNNRRRWEKRLWVIGYKDRPCADCRRKYPYFVMDFDHRDPAQKSHEPARLASTGSWKALKAEVAKCDVVCANCHRIRTNKDRDMCHVPRSRGEMPELAELGLAVLKSLNRIQVGLDTAEN